VFRGSYGTCNKSIGDIDMYTEVEKLMDGNLQYLTPLLIYLYFGRS
jgi:hypothetical protein